MKGIKQIRNAGYLVTIDGIRFANFSILTTKYCVMGEDIRIKKVEILAKDRHPLKKITFDKQDKNGDWQTQDRELYDRGNAATILLYNPEKNTVILTRQFRIPTYVNGNPTGMLIEACAGMLDGDSPEDCARREALEETGYNVKNLTKIFELYMSAGGITELLYFFTAKYSEEDKVSGGGGLQDEEEDIEVLELSVEKAFEMITNGEIKDAKTVILLQYARIHKLFE